MSLKKKIKRVDFMKIARPVDLVRERKDKKNMKRIILTLCLSVLIGMMPSANPPVLAFDYGGKVNGCIHCYHCPVEMGQSFQQCPSPCSQWANDCTGAPSNLPDYCKAYYECIGHCTKDWNGFLTRDSFCVHQCDEAYPDHLFCGQY